MTKKVVKKKVVKKKVPKKPSDYDSNRPTTETLERRLSTQERISEQIMKQTRVKPLDYKFGRPTNYKPEYCEKLIKHMSMGYSFETFALTVNATPKMVYRWVKDKEDFRHAKELADKASRLFWEGVGIEGSVGDLKNWSAPGWAFNMKNRFGWHDQHDKDKTQTVQPILINLPISGETKKIEMQETLSIEAKDEEIEDDE